MDGIFEGFCFVISSSINLKEKKVVLNKIKKNGGKIGYLLNSNCTHFVVDENNVEMDGSRVEKAKEIGKVLVISSSFIHKCDEEKKRLDENNFFCLQTPRKQIEEKILELNEPEEVRSEEVRQIENEEMVLVIRQNVLPTAIFILEQVKKLSIENEKQNIHQEQPKALHLPSKTRKINAENTILKTNNSSNSNRPTFFEQASLVCCLQKTDETLENLLKWDPLKSLNPPSLTSPSPTSSPHFPLLHCSSLYFPFLSC